MAKRASKKSAGSHAVASQEQAQKQTTVDLFTRFAIHTSHWAGRPLTFIIAVTLVLVWATSGPIFGFSDTWQLVINTSTTIVTFLMVFLIQNTQNRDTLALQIKLAELILAARGAEDRLATAEDLSDGELKRLHAEYHDLATTALSHLESRRPKGPRGRG